MEAWSWLHWFALCAAVVALVTAPFLIARALGRLKELNGDDDDDDSAYG